jgi:uncharacterized protein YhjY with autotransporter beta-barrel domain
MNKRTRILRSVCTTTAGCLLFSSAARAQIAPSLGTASSFAVLGGSTVTNTGPTIVVGNLGVSPGTAITGFPPGILVGGTFHNADGVAASAHADTVTAYNFLAGEASTMNLTGQTLGVGVLTLTPGVYTFNTSAQLTGTITLNTLGNSNAPFIFQIGSTLTTASGSSVMILGGGSDPNIFFQVGSSAILGTATTFVGNILALTSITLDTGASISDGRALAINGAVTLDSNNISALVTALGPGVPSSPLPFLPPGSTPNETAVVNNIDGIVTNAIFNATNLGDFNAVLGGVLTAAALPGAAYDHALDELDPQRFEILDNVAFDEFAFSVQDLDLFHADVRDGESGLDTSHFAVNDSTLGSQLSQVKSHLAGFDPKDMAEPKDMKDDMKDEAAEAPPLNNWNAFIDGGVDIGDLDGNQDITDSDYTGYRVRGGADFRVTRDLRVGGLFGYEHTDVDLDNEGSRAHVDGYTPGIYASYSDRKGFYANGLFTYTRNDYTTDRRIVIPGVDRTANGSTSGDQFSGDLDGGYEFHAGDWVLGPNAGLTYVNLGIDGFNETGADTADLDIGQESSDSLRSRVGGMIRYRGRIGSVTVCPHASAFWQHEFLDRSRVLTSSFADVPAAGAFGVNTTEGDRDNALLGAGVNVGINQYVTVFADYGAEVGGETFFGESATGGVRVSY